MNRLSCIGPLRVRWPPVRGGWAPAFPRAPSPPKDEQLESHTVAGVPRSPRIRTTWRSSRIPRPATPRPTTVSGVRPSLFEHPYMISMCTNQAQKPCVVPEEHGCCDTDSNPTPSTCQACAQHSASSRGIERACQAGTRFQRLCQLNGDPACTQGGWRHLGPRSFFPNWTRHSVKGKSKSPEEGGKQR